MNHKPEKEITLEMSFAFSREIMKKRAKSFFQAFQNLPEERFRGVTALYAFCRYADDVVDNDQQERTREDIIAALAELEKNVQQLSFLEDHSVEVEFVRNQPWWLAFEHTVRFYHIPLESFFDQIKGQRGDVDFEDIRTIEELVEYGRLVAGSVGVMMLPLLSKEKEDAFIPEFVKACENLGVGMQITNILRDVGEDLRTRNRLYIPKELLEKKGIKREELLELANESPKKNLSEKIPKEFVELWEELSSLADVYYKDYEKWLFHFHSASRVPIVAAALIYHEIAEEVRKNGYNCFTKRSYTTAMTRAFLLKKAYSMVDKKNTL